MNYPKIVLHKGKERSLQLFHPWVFSGAIKSQPAGLTEGDIVETWSNDDKYLGTGHFHKGTITVRILTFENEIIDTQFWQKKIQKAFECRKALGFLNGTNTNVYRLLHGEGDNLPGLIIDIYHDTAVIQAHTIGMSKHRLEIAAALREIYQDSLKAIYDKSADSLQKQNLPGLKNEYIYNEKPNTIESEVKENDYIFSIDYINGQKTGFFIDQRENRKLLSQYSKNKNVLNTFCYTGGFSVYALAAGASLVHSVDSSKKAISDTEKNVLLNFRNAPHECFSIDVFDFFKKNEKTYDVIILDPPAFAKHISAVKNAMVGYRNLNLEAFKKIDKGGILFTFSCSQAIDKELFRKVVFQAAAQSKRNVRILHQLSQPSDHPINIYHPEGEYLKGLVLFVE